MENRLPLVYLVDSAGVFLAACKTRSFPTRTISAGSFATTPSSRPTGIPQFAAIMGNCVAGGGYLPVLCDKLLMTEGSGLYLAGPALVKAAIGQTVEPRRPGRRAHARRDQRHHRFPRTERGFLPRTLAPARRRAAGRRTANRAVSPAARRPPTGRYLQATVNTTSATCLRAILDPRPVRRIQGRVRPDARLRLRPAGRQSGRRRRQSATSAASRRAAPIQFGGVIYADSADKAARFIMDCNQTRVPILFLQNVNGFMVGKDAEQSGIIRAGAKLVNAISNSVVPKITLITGGSFGAGNYALCGKAFDPRFILAWPNARYAVMGGDQAASTLLDITVSALKRGGHEPDAKEMADLRDKVKASYDEQTDIRYAAARLWVDRIVAPEDTRS